METPPASNHERLLENFVNRPHSILRLRLQPFCLLHWLWLEYIASPFVITSKEISLADIELAALVCSSRTSEQILAKITAKNGNIWKRTAARLWHWRNRKTDLKAASQAFIAYQDDYCSLPEFAAEGSNRDPKLPVVLYYAASLIKETGWAEDTVLTMPLGKVVWYNAALGYLNSGDTSIISDRERQAMAALDALTGAGK